jgi:hypothetical protein
LNEASDALVGLNTRATALAVVELDKELSAHKIDIDYEQLTDYFQEIAITLRRELSLTKIFCIASAKEHYFDLDINILGQTFKSNMPSAIFELDEAGKCHALGRSTACVFHLMRTMEIGIKALARSLSISDPIKPSEKNWGKILGSMKAEMDKRSGGKSWEGNDKEFFESAYVSLDAVRVAWRNTTMHVENKYTEDEAEHIFVAVRGFMKKLSSRMDEDGKPLA